MLEFIRPQLPDTRLLRKVGTGLCLSTLSLIALLTAMPSATHAEIDLGTKGAFAFGLDTDLIYDSNIELNEDEVDDFIAVFLPKLLYRYNEGAVRIDAFVGVQYDEYKDEDQYSSNSFKSGFELEYPSVELDRNFALKLNGGYNESTSADSDIQAVVERETTSFDLEGRYFFADRYFVRSGGSYRSEDTVSSGYDDVEVLSIPVDFFYRYSEFLNLGFGYRYRDTSVDGSGATADSEDHAVYLVSEGRITPTIDGKIKVGGQRRDFSDSDFDDTDSFFVESVVTWDATTQSKVKLSAGNEFGTSVGNQSVDAVYVELEWRHQFDDKITGILGVGYEERDYSKVNDEDYRSDDVYFVSVGGEYSLIENRLSLEGLFYYSDQSSDHSSSEYDHQIARIGLRLIY